MHPGPEPEETSFDSLTRGTFTYFPVVPGKVEFAVALRRMLLASRPQVVAIELPGLFETSLRQALRRLPELSVLLCAPKNDEDNAVYFPVEPADPFIEAARTALEIGASILFLEPDRLHRPHVSGSYPDTAAIPYIGLDTYVRQYRLFPQPQFPQMEEHAAGMAWKLQGADPFLSTVVVVSLNLLNAVMDAMEVPQSEPQRPDSPLGVRLLNPHPDSLAEITVEMPWLLEKYLAWRENQDPSIPFPNRTSLQYELLKEAEQSYVAITGDRIVHWQRRMLARYTRNLAQTQQELCAGLYDLTVAARSIVDDNYGWEVWQIANRYAYQHEQSSVETVRLSADELYLATRKLRIRRRLPRPKQLTRPQGLKPRQKEKRPGEWAASTDSNSICSYPPEDIIIENYGQFLKRKGKSVLSEERTRVEPFSTSLHDGIDIRETIRNWHHGVIFVRQLQRLHGEVGAVCVIFDEDRENRYTYHTTWLGENQNESDMAFYSTHPFDHMVGPGIGRAEYGGLLMTLPPRRLFDVWRDPDYAAAESKPERLLLAALDYSVERYVVYVAAKPPRSLFRTIANHLGRKIIYLPLGQLSPTKLKKIRVVHVLDGHHRRDAAKEFIW
jgi:hypothetical protein